MSRYVGSRLGCGPSPYTGTQLVKYDEKHVAKRSAVNGIRLRLVTNRGQGFDDSGMDCQPHFFRSLSLDRKTIPRPSFQPK